MLKERRGLSTTAAIIILAVAIVAVLGGSYLINSPNSPFKTSPDSATSTNPSAAPSTPSTTPAAKSTGIPTYPSNPRTWGTAIKNYFSKDKSAGTSSSTSGGGGIAATTADDTLMYIVGTWILLLVGTFIFLKVLGGWQPNNETIKAYVQSQHSIVRFWTSLNYTLFCRKFWWGLIITGGTVGLSWLLSSPVGTILKWIPILGNLPAGVQSVLDFVGTVWFWPYYLFSGILPWWIKSIITWVWIIGLPFIILSWRVREKRRLARAMAQREQLARRTLRAEGESIEDDYSDTSTHD